MEGGAGGRGVGVCGGVLGTTSTPEEAANQEGEVKESSHPLLSRNTLGD